MQTSIENTGAIARKMTVTVPNDRIQTASAKRLKELSKTAKIDGFRKGKVPLAVIKTRYADSVYFEVVEKVIDETLREALMAEKINPAAFPDINPTSMEKGKDLVYVADFDVMPEIKDISLKGVKVKTVVAEIKDSDIDDSIEQLRKQQVEWKAVKRKAKKSDRITIDFLGSIEGVEFDGGKSEDMPIVLGEGQMLEDFEKGLIGLKAGEEATIKVDFPEAYPGVEVAGKSADFAITVKDVSAPQLPEVDDAFAEKYNSKDVAALRAEISKTIDSNVDSSLSSINRIRAFDALVGKMAIEVPRKLVQEEIERMVAQQKDQMKQRGVDPELYNPDNEALSTEATKRVALGLIMMQCIEDNDIKVDDEKVQAYLAKMAIGYEESEQFIAYYNNDKQRLAQIESIVLETQVVEFLMKEATVSDEKVSVNDVLNGKVS